MVNWDYYYNLVILRLVIKMVISFFEGSLINRLFKLLSVKCNKLFYLFFN